MHQIGKGAVLFLLLLSVAGTAAAVTSYDIVLDKESADINVTVELYPENPDRTTQLTSSWQMPDGTVIMNVTDSDGPLEYEVDGSQVTFETTITPGEGKEVVEIDGSLDRAVSEEYRGLDLYKFQLSGFRDRKPDVPDEVTQVQLTAERPLLSESHSFGFDTSLGEREVNYSGEGPVNLHLAVSDEGEWYENFVLFGPGNLSTADDLYWVPAAVTGFLPQVNRFPVVVYPDEEYDVEVDEWSAGQYRKGGITFVRKSELEKEGGAGLILHEVMHGFNEEALAWTSATRSWFDEGTASYIQWLVNEERGVRQAEIFGGEVTWREGRSRYTLQPRMEPQDLWDYYSGDRNFMEDWKLTENPERKTFGYAYSELLIRDFVRREGPSSLRPVYGRLLEMDRNVEEEVSSISESNDMLLEALETDFRPCYSSSKGEMESCLEQVNDMDSEVPELGELQNRTEKVEIEKVEEPVADSTRGELVLGGGNFSRTVEKGVLNSLKGYIESIRNWFISLFRSGQ